MLSRLIANALEGKDYNCRGDALVVCSILTPLNKFDVILREKMKPYQIFFLFLEKGSVNFSSVSRKIKYES